LKIDIANCIDKGRSFSINLSVITNVDKLNEDVVWLNKEHKQLPIEISLYYVKYKGERLNIASDDKIQGDWLDYKTAP
jgi:hypothetical protein